MNVKRITIKGESGFWQSYDPFREKITLTSNSISYEWWKLRPFEISCGESSGDDLHCENFKDNDPLLENWKKDLKWWNHKKWSYRSENPEFHTKFQMISEEVMKIMGDGERFFCLDAGMYEFILTWEDGSKTSMSTFSVSECFPNIFTLIEQLIPSLELASYREFSVFALCDDEEDDDAEKDEEDENDENGFEKIDEE